MHVFHKKNFLRYMHELTTNMHTFIHVHLVGLLSFDTVIQRNHAYV